MWTYPVELVEAADGVTVSFPDIPEAITHGADIEEAMARAVDALETALEMYVAAGQDIPRPSKAKRAQSTVEPALLFSMKLHLYQGMRDRNVRKAQLARDLNWHLPQVDRVLNLHHESRLDQMEAALKAIGKKVELSVH